MKSFKNNIFLKSFFILLVIVTFLLSFIFLTEYLPYNEYTTEIKETHRKFMSNFSRDYSNKMFRNVDVSLLNKNIIPPVLYKTGYDNYEDLPEETKENFKKIMEENPDYTIEYYSDEDSMAFIEKNFDNDVLVAYKKLKPGAFKADLFRYCILYKKGGVYGDLNQEYLVSLDELVDREKDKLVLSRDGYFFLKDYGIDIAFMAAVKELDLFEKCINQIVENVKKKLYTISALGVTGPWLMRNVFVKNEEAQRLYKMEIRIDKDGGDYIVFGNGKRYIKRKSKLHNNYMYLNKKHYSGLWKKRDIYDDEISF